LASGRRKLPAISIYSPRDTITSFPAASVLSVINKAAALLLTAVAVSEPVSSQAVVGWRPRAGRPAQPLSVHETGVQTSEFPDSERLQNMPLSGKNRGGRSPSLFTAVPAHRLPQARTTPVVACWDARANMPSVSTAWQCHETPHLGRPSRILAVRQFRLVC
jgi:hypothetical protein